MNLIKYIKKAVVEIKMSRTILLLVHVLMMF